MEIQILNGTSNAQLNGFNRISAVGSRGSINGFNRINYMNGFTLNGYTLNGYELNAVEDYCEMCHYYGDTPTLNGLRDFFARRKAQRQERKQARPGYQRRERRREARTQNVEMKPQRQAERRERARNFLSKIGKVGEQVASQKFGIQFPDMSFDDMGENDMPLFLDDTVMSDKGYLFGKPPFEPWRGKWWGSSRVPVWQKAAVGAGGAVLFDQLLLKGKFTNPILGINKGKARK